MENFVKRYPSPDGRYEVVTCDNEMRMSHWVTSASLVDAATRATVVDVGGVLWSADAVAWSPDGAAVTMPMRRYPGDCPGVVVTLRPAARSATVETPGGPVEAGFAELSAALERYYEANKTPDPPALTRRRRR